MSARHPRRPLWAAWAASLWLLALAPAAHAQSGTESSVGYIDNAIPVNQLRLRFDASYDYPFPDRGAFGYSRSALDPGQSAEPKANAQEFSTYAEFALLPRLSAFVEAPVRAINPTIDPDASGLGDVNAGGKFAFIYQEDFVATLQLRVYAQTASKQSHLGSGHSTIEPGLLTFARLTDRLIAEGELRLWAPLTQDGGYNSDVIRYGLGASYRAWERPGLAVLPVAEFVGWSFLDGRKHVNAPDGTGIEVSAAGDTIVNVKLGVRLRTDYGQFYVGYGRSLTGTPFYQNILRVEYRFIW
jgi:hypothetical protein